MCERDVMRGKRERERGADRVRSGVIQRSREMQSYERAREGVQRDEL